MTIRFQPTLFLLQNNQFINNLVNGKNLTQSFTNSNQLNNLSCLLSLLKHDFTNLADSFITHSKHHGKHNRAGIVNTTFNANSNSALSDTLEQINQIIVKIFPTKADAAQNKMGDIMQKLVQQYHLLLAINTKSNSQLLQNASLVRNELNFEAYELQEQHVDLQDLQEQIQGNLEQLNDNFAIIDAKYLTKKLAKQTTKLVNLTSNDLLRVSANSAPDAKLIIKEDNAISKYSEFNYLLMLQQSQISLLEKVIDEDGQVTYCEIKLSSRELHLLMYFFLTPAQLTKIINLLLAMITLWPTKIPKYKSDYKDQNGDDDIFSVFAPSSIAT